MPFVKKPFQTLTSKDLTSSDDKLQAVELKIDKGEAELLIRFLKSKESSVERLKLNISSCVADVDAMTQSFNKYLAEDKKLRELIINVQNAQSEQSVMYIINNILLSLGDSKNSTLQLFTIESANKIYFSNAFLHAWQHVVARYQKKPITGLLVFNILEKASGNNPGNTVCFDLVKDLLIPINATQHMKATRLKYLENQQHIVDPIWDTLSALKDAKTRNIISSEKILQDFLYIEKASLYYEHLYKFNEAENFVAQLQWMLEAVDPQGCVLNQEIILDKDLILSLKLSAEQNQLSYAQETQIEDLVQSMVSNMRAAIFRWLSFYSQYLVANDLLAQCYESYPIVHAEEWKKTYPDEWRQKKWMAAMHYFLGYCQGDKKMSSELFRVCRKLIGLDEKGTENEIDKTSRKAVLLWLEKKCNQKEGILALQKWEYIYASILLVLSEEEDAVDNSNLKIGIKDVRYNYTAFLKLVCSVEKLKKPLEDFPIQKELISVLTNKVLKVFWDNFLNQLNNIGSESSGKNSGAKKITAGDESGEILRVYKILQQENLFSDNPLVMRRYKNVLAVLDPTDSIDTMKAADRLKLLTLKLYKFCHVDIGTLEVFFVSAMEDTLKKLWSACEELKGQNLNQTVLLQGSSVLDTSQQSISLASGWLGNLLNQKDNLSSPKKDERSDQYLIRIQKILNKCFSQNTKGVAKLVTLSLESSGLIQPQSMEQSANYTNSSNNNNNGMQSTIFQKQ